MRKSSLLIVLICIVFLIPQLFAGVDKDILVVVNGEKITLDEFNVKVNSEITEKNITLDNDFRNKILNQMISDKVLQQEAKKQNISVTGSQLDKAIEQIRARFSTESLFKDELKKEHVTYGQFKDRIIGQLKQMKLIQQCIRSKYHEQEEVQRQYEIWVRQLRLERYIWINPSIEWVKIDASGDIRKNSISSKIKNIAVSDFDAIGTSVSEAITVTDLMRSDLVESNRYSVMDRKNMELLLSEQKLQSSGGTSQENAVNIGKILNVQAIVVGSVSELMGEYIINVSIVDVESGIILASFNEKATNLDEIRSASKRLASNLCK